MFSSDAIIAGLHHWRYGLLRLLLALAVGPGRRVQAALRIRSTLRLTRERLALEYPGY